MDNNFNTGMFVKHAARDHGKPVQNVHFQWFYVRNASPAQRSWPRKTHPRLIFWIIVASECLSKTLLVSDDKSARTYIFHWFYIWKCLAGTRLVTTETPPELTFANEFTSGMPIQHCAGDQRKLLQNLHLAMNLHLECISGVPLVITENSSNTYIFNSARNRGKLIQHIYFAAILCHRKSRKVWLMSTCDNPNPSWQRCSKLEPRWAVTSENFRGGLRRPTLFKNPIKQTNETPPYIYIYIYIYICVCFLLLFFFGFGSVSPPLRLP